MVTGRYGVPLLGLAKSIYYIDLAKPKSGGPLFVLSVFCFCFLFCFCWQLLICENTLIQVVLLKKKKKKKKNSCSR